MVLFKYFKVSEFDSPDLPGSGSSMNPTTLERLIIARHFAQTFFVINSGFRTSSHNASVGGEKDSAHLTGHAVDISCTNSQARFKIITSLYKAGFTRMGIYPTHIHVDDDPTKPSNVI